jgi:hypothetical protein
MDVAIWFPPPSRTSATKAVVICRDCPVKLDCLAAAMIEEAGSRRERRHGYRGGLGPEQRAQLEVGVDAFPAA